MAGNPYPTENLDALEDDGTMPANVAELSKNVVGHKIVSVESNVFVGNANMWSGNNGWGTVLTLDNGKQVILHNTNDCCAYTDLEKITMHLDKIKHVITGVGTTNNYDTWHIYADLGDVVEMQVGWSSGNPFYYGYGFEISVRDVPEMTA